MTAWERLKLSPFQKWKYYGLPPWKLFLSLLLIASTTVNVYQLSDTITPYSRAQSENWETMLIPDSIDSHTVGSATTYYIYTIDDFMDSLANFTLIYYTLNTSVVGSYKYKVQHDIIKPITMRIHKYKYPNQVFDPENNNYNDATIRDVYYLQNQSDYGPFSLNASNVTGRTTLIHSLIKMTLGFSVKNLGFVNGYRTCYVDEVKEIYSFYYRGRIDLTISPEISICDEQYRENIWDRQYLVLIIFLCLTCSFSFTSQILQIKAVFKHISIFYQVQSKSLESNTNLWKNMTLRDKLEFFNLWFITTSIANIANIIGSISCSYLLLIQTNQSQWDAPLFFIGIGCMFSWISSIQYLEMFPNYYALILTLRKSAPRVLAFLVGVMPVFLGFAYFGVAYFSTGSALFANVDQSAVALFALLNGDVIHDVFDNIYPISPVISRIYLYSFISLFIYAVLNIFIAIVEDAFFAAKQETEQETQEDLGQKNFDFDNLDVIALVTGPPISNEQFQEDLSTDDDFDSLNGDDGEFKAPKLMGLFEASKSVGSKSVNSINSGIQALPEDGVVTGRKPIRLTLTSPNDGKPAASSPHSISMKRSYSKSRTDQFSLPLLKSLRKTGDFSRSERVLLSAVGSPTFNDRDGKHKVFLKILNQLITSYNKEFLNDIRKILSQIDTNLRPPHSFDNYPCGFDDCIYCKLKNLLQINMQTLRNNVAHSIETTINSESLNKLSCNDDQ